MDIQKKKMEHLSIGGQDILTYDAIKQMRKEEENNKDSKLFIAQSGAQEYGLGNVADIVVFGGNRGGGKANSYLTQVATPSGYRRMGDLEVGDLICTPYNGVQKVSAIYEQGVQNIYNFYFDDGTCVPCMDNHRFWARIGTDGDFKEMDAREIMNRYALDRPFPVSLRRGISEYVEIPLCGEVELNEKKTEIDLPLHPFLLGFIINENGKWEFTRSGIRLTDDTYLARSLSMFGHILKKNRSNNFYYIKGITLQQRKRITNSMREHDAVIPKEYMTASIQSRWELLKGIMWKNGKSKSKHPYLILPNKTLIENIADIARSLGVWCRVSQVDDIPEKIGFWKVVFVAPSDKDFWGKKAYFDRAHVNACKPTNPQMKGVLTKKLLCIKKSKTRQNCRCITVTGRDHLYMTEGYTINHNTITMLMEPMYDIMNKHFNGYIFRRNKDDFDNIINESKRWFSGLGRYNKSKDDMTWYFKTGAKLGLTIYDMPMVDFDRKFRGQQFAYIGIDELPQMPFEMFKFLMTSNRNTVGVHSRMLGTCNPDPLSWLRKFIDWWIGKEDTIYSDGKKHPERKGFAIPERNGAIRYCYMPEDTVDTIIWGDTPEEVYEQCKEKIDDAWDPEWEQYGYTKTSFFVKSVTFIKASLKDNKALIKSDPSYIANLLNQPPEIRAREFDGNWDVVKAGEDMIQPYHLERVYGNSQMVGDRIRRVTCDIAGDGGDSCVLWLWIGWHVADIFVCKRDPYATVSIIRAKLQEWGVIEENFAFDLNGMGQVLKGAFPRAVRFNNQEAVDNKDKYLFDNKKSQCAYRFAERTQQGEWSIEPTLLSRKFKTGGNTSTLRDILLKERKCVKQDISKADKGWCIIHKEQMKSRNIVGHSPDFFEALFMREIFEVKSVTVTIPTFLKNKMIRHRSFSTRRVIT